jgi:diadenosine tetraphosphate (Ap4A) HIT family hydrolase
MSLIYETKNFIVESHEKPLVSRTDGGHIRIAVKDKSIRDRTELNSKMAIELMRLTMVVGESLQTVMNQQGIPVVKINYQDMGNWAYKENKEPYLHIHIFGRAANAIKQPFPESVYLPDRSSGFYDGFEALSQEDCDLIKENIEKVFELEKYSDKEWGLI